MKKSIIAVLTVVMIMGMGCASNSELKKVEADAREAHQVADQAYQMAQQSKDMAQAADERSQRNEEVLNRHFKRSMYK